MRLARFGYRSGVVASSTYEEAPAGIGRWLGQRTRWFKGWMRLSRNKFFLCFQKHEHSSTLRRNTIATT
jgi:cellulose synthase/poly-beta-1,6-N-acetylglucosamine synthase-like glycosyltransferase